MEESMDFPTPNFKLGITDVSKREFLFARDLIRHIVRLQSPDFEFIDPYRTSSGKSPFNPRIRRSIELYLSTGETVFQSTFRKLDESFACVTNANFNAFMKDMQFLYVETVDNYEGMIRFCTTVAYFSSLAYARGANIAPFIALQTLHAALSDFIRRSKKPEDEFWLEMGSDKIYRHFV